MSHRKRQDEAICPPTPVNNRMQELPDATHPRLMDLAAQANKVDCTRATNHHHFDRPFGSCTYLFCAGGKLLSFTSKITNIKIFGSAAESLSKLIVFPY